MKRIKNDAHTLGLLADELEYLSNHIGRAVPAHMRDQLDKDLEEPVLAISRANVRILDAMENLREGQEVKR